MDIAGLVNVNKKLVVCQNLVPLVNIKIAGKWMFIPLKMVLIGIDPYPTELGELQDLGTIHIRLLGRKPWRHCILHFVAKNKG
jgi:hypothetical protein